MADFILHMPPRFFARVFGNPAGDPVLLKSRGVTLLRDSHYDILAKTLSRMTTPIKMMLAYYLVLRKSPTPNLVSES